MVSERQHKTALWSAVVLFFIGIVCYAAASVKTPDEPIRVMFRNVAGHILFDHKVHTDDYGIACEDCHHNLTDKNGDEEIWRCNTCHKPDSEDIPKSMNAYHQCIDCHEDMGAGPVACDECHMM